MNCIDIILLLILGVSVFQGYKRGFIKMSFHLVGLIITFFISKGYSYIVENFLISKTNLYDYMHTFFYSNGQWLVNVLKGNSSSSPDNLTSIVKLPKFISSIFLDSLKFGQTNNYDMLINNITDFFIRSLGFIITFFAIYVILLLLCEIIDIVFKLPVLNLTNKVCGGILGLGKSILILYIIFALMTPLIAFLPDNHLTKNITKSKSYSIFYENNIILNYLSYKGYYDK